MNRYSSRGRARYRRHPIIPFLLVASFGILFVGCSGPGEQDEEFVFTEDDVARYRDLADDAAVPTGSGSSQPYLEPLASGSGTHTDEVVLDLSLVDSYKAMREGTAAGASDMFQVTNEFLNVRAQPSTTAASVDTLDFGESIHVTEFINGTWAKVKLADGREGYVSHRYIAKPTSEERLSTEKSEYENTYYVSYGFVNLRSSADAASAKLAEIPGQTMLQVSNISGDWGTVSYDGKEGYVSMSYLQKFEPNFIVRQESYDLPVLHYKLTRETEAELLRQMTNHITQLLAEGYTFMTVSDFYALLLQQQERDVRLSPKSVILGVSGVTSANVRAVSDALNATPVNATLFLETQNIGLSGITEKNIITLMANGFDLQSAGHTGDDLRALTNAQVELELQQSRKLLEDYTRKSVFAIAWPQGGVNDRVSQLAADAGYLLGFGDNADRTFSRSQFLRIPAMTIFPSMTDDEVLKFVKGS